MSTFQDFNLLVSVLEKADDPQFSAAWDYLYQTPQVWSKIGELGPARCASILNNGYHTWTTSFSLQKLALLMHTLTGVAMVHNTFANYRDVLLYALSLVWDVTLDFDVQLIDTLAAAAFGLAQLPHAKAAHDTPKAGITTHGDDFEEDNEDEVVELPYDETSWSLPPWFAEAWSRSRDPDGVRFDLRKVLENLPLINQIPRRPQDNNHNNDAKRLIDRTCKTWQQKLLHALRILGNLSLADNDEGPYEGLLHVFHLLAKLEQSMSDFRKTQSVRDSVVHSNQLFGKEELAAANLASRINRLGKSWGKGKGKNQYKGQQGQYFRHSKGKSYGGYGSYGSYGGRGRGGSYPTYSNTAKPGAVGSQ